MRGQIASTAQFAKQAKPLTLARAEAYSFSVSKVEEIFSEIEKLSPRERCELHALLNPLPDDDWDKQMRADAEPGGKLHKLMLEAEEDAKAGRLRDLPTAD